MAVPTSARAPKRVLLASPRGYCAGVDRAVQTVERALELYGPPVYVRKEIVHNKHVVAELTERGAIFVEEETEVPEGEMVVFSAHGVAPSVHANSKARNLRTIDATCPLVTKVHVEARKFAEEGYTIVLIGHEGHEEVEGTTGEAPGSIVLVETAEDVDALEVDDPNKIAYITQTTLSVDETTQLITRLRERFPAIIGPKSDDICYATTNRQIAVKQLARECDLVLVIGSTNSSNSNRLVEVARARRRLPPAGQRRSDPGGVARWGRDGWHHLGGERPGRARRRAGRVLRGARGGGRLRAPNGRRGCPVHASQGDSRGTGRARVTLAVTAVVLVASAMAAPAASALPTTIRTGGPSAPDDSKVASRAARWPASTRSTPTRTAGRTTSHPSRRSTRLPRPSCCSRRYTAAPAERL